MKSEGGKLWCINQANNPPLDLLHTVRTYNMQQGILVVGVETLVQLSHEGGLVYEREAAKRMNVCEILFDYASCMSFVR